MVKFEEDHGVAKLGCGYLYLMPCSSTHWSDLFNSQLLNLCLVEAIEKVEKGQEEELESKGWRTEKLEAQSCRINSVFTELESEVRKSSNGGKCGEFCILLCVSAGTAVLSAIEMAGRGRDDAAIAEALGMLAGVLGGNPNVVGIGAARQLSEFQKNNPPMFKGAYDPDGVRSG
ncbi:hypothetical protein KIW84_033808 [Lathyrus oleraceus]|uniref:Uncharacterized protein n=1 Tax=Pisum sativum TaxID=3888 RepID=A0A9D4Y1N7_PEA|nr:hypothetical protein KIW84_033808 [Pisum sativum]